MFQKVGDWLTDKSDRFIRGDDGSPGSYYASSEAEQAYGRMQANAPIESAEPQATEYETERIQAIDSYDRAGKDYGGRVPYRSQRDLQAQQSAMEAERQRLMREEQSRQYVPPAQPVPQAQAPFQHPSYAGQQGAPMQQGTPVQQGAPMQQQVDYQQRQQGGYQQPQRQQSNVVPFPGMQQAPDGNLYIHTEYIVLLRSRNECKNVIEYIKANASVFLNMEFIASDSERQRCVDMLSGAAYTLGCLLNKISPRGIYLISSPSVHVLIDPALQKFTSAPEAQGFVRQSYETGAYGTQRQVGGYQSGGYARSPHEVGQQATSRFSAPVAGYASQSPNPQHRNPNSFGSVMAGHVTASYPAVSALQGAGAATGRYSMKDYPQQ